MGHQVIPPRRPDWRQRLHAYVAAAWRQPFDWAGANCGLFVAGAIEAMTGVDPAEALRGRCGSAAAARRALRRLGYEDHVAMAAAWLAPCAPAESQVGDVAVVPTADGERALGLVAGHRVLVMRPEGLGSVGLLDACAAFRVP